MTFNESDENDTAKMYEEIDDSIQHKKYDHDVGPIESMFNSYGMGDNKFIPSNPPQFQSPSTFLGPHRSPGPDFRSKNNLVHIINPNQDAAAEDNPVQK